MGVALLLSKSSSQTRKFVILLIRVCAPASKEAPLSLSVSKGKEGEWTLVRVSGEVDLFNSADLRAGLLEGIEAGGDMAVDLNEVGFMDSTGFGVLVGILKRMREAGRTLVLARPQPAVTRILAVTGLDRVFPVYDSVDEFSKEVVREPIGTNGRIG